MRLKLNLKTHGPDSREGLGPLVASFIVMLLLSAGYKAQGVFFDAALREFNATRQEISWPMSIYQFAMNFSGLLIGPLAERFSIRPVFGVCVIIGALGFFLSYFVTDFIWFSVTYGLMGGVSYGAAMLAASILMTQYFDKFRAVTIGMTFTGSAVGLFMFPTILSILDEKLGFHAMLAINGAICAVAIPVTWYLKEAAWIDDSHQKRSSSENIPQEDNGKESAPPELSTPDADAHKASLLEQLSVLINPLFWLLCVPMVCYYWANMCCLTTIVDFHKTETNYTDLQCVNLITAFGVAELIGQLGLPQLCDRGLILRETLLLVNFLAAGLLLLLLPIAPNFATSITLISFLGPFYTLSATFYRCFVGEYLGMHRMKSAFGLLAAIKGACLLATPLFIGYCRDTLHNYRIMYNICGALLIGPSLVYVPVIIKKRRAISG